MKSLIILIFALVLSSAAKAQDPLSQLAQSEQTLVREYFYRQFTPFIADYVAVFHAQIACKYDFIDDVVFNDLADSSIKHLITQLEDFLATSKFEGAKNDEVRRYIANFVGVGLIDAQANLLSAQQVIDYQLPQSCQQHAQKNKQAYEQLKAEVATILNSRGFQ